MSRCLPLKTVWSRLKISERIEMWPYLVEGDATELYFLRGSKVVDDLVFAPEGVVYESR